MKTIRIVVHSAEGVALCFLTACREGGVKLGPHMEIETNSLHPILLQGNQTA